MKPQSRSLRLLGLLCLIAVAFTPLITKVPGRTSEWASPRLEENPGDFAQTSRVNMPSSGSGIFGPQTAYSVAFEPFSVVAIDLNGDGHCDIATNNYYTISVLLSDGHGEFDRLDYGMGERGSSIVAADLDGDGHVDLAGCGPSSNHVFVRWNNGHGIFPDRTFYSVGADPITVCTADFNGNGLIDLAVANTGSDYVSILLNWGDRSFAPQDTVPVGVAPYAVFAADLNNDGAVDFATTNMNTKDVSVRLNWGDGTFAAPWPYPVGNGEPYGGVAADLDGDGDMDLATANGNSNVSVLMNDGNATFAAPRDYPVDGDSTLWVVAADLDDDCNLDLVTANYKSHNISVLINRGDGTFHAPADYPVGVAPPSVFAADLDGDGDHDLVTANSCEIDCPSPPTYTVSVLLNEDRGEPTGCVFDVTNTDNSGVGSLRLAIKRANAHANLATVVDSIQFNIPYTPPHPVVTIQPTSALPTITDPVIIDGYTQPGARANTNGPGLGSNASLRVELNGDNAGDGVNGLEISGGNSVVRGLVINGFFLSGIHLRMHCCNKIEGNFIGTDPTGTDWAGNANGVSISNTSDHVIGGETPEARNIISANRISGVSIDGNLAIANSVKGNFIGTDPTGTTGPGNSWRGVGIVDAADNLIGGPTPEARNVISDNGLAGVTIFGADAVGNVVAGNYIGTDVTGTAAIGNGWQLEPFPHGGVTIEHAGPNLIGGTAAGERNIISGNNGAGVFIGGSFTGLPRSVGNWVQGNYIGTDVTGTQNLRNLRGVWIHGATDSKIGGTEDGAGNIIAFNSPYDGVTVQDALDPPHVHNVIMSNSIFSNGGLGIDLADDGVTPNDDNDPDQGPNNLQNYPELLSAVGLVSRNETIVELVFNGAGDVGLIYEFFSNTACDPSGHGEGDNFLGSRTSATNASGNDYFKLTFPTAVPPGHFVTATATALENNSDNTSEFSECIEVLGDTDNDGIVDNVDTEPTMASDTFSDVDLFGATTGNIDDRGDQILIVWDSTNDPPLDGISISADPSGGALAAVITGCDGTAIIGALEPGDEVIMTCGSSRVDVVVGTVDVRFEADDGRFATSSLPAGNGLVFEPVTFTITAPETNTETVIVVVDNEEFVLEPGETLGWVELECPADTPIPASTVSYHELSGFQITNGATTSLSFTYTLASDGPATLVDNGDPASLGGTTPVLAPGDSYTTPSAALEIPEISGPTEHTVTYHVAAVEDPVIVESCATVVSICEQPVLTLLGYRQIAWNDPMWTVQVEVRNTGPGVAKDVTVTMDEGIPWLTIPDRHCFYGDISEDATSWGGADGYTFDLSNCPGGSFNVWFDVAHGDECGNRYMVRLDPEFDPETPTGIMPGAVAEYRLDQNHPNPFNPTTKIRFQIPNAERVTLKVYDVSGKLVRTLMDGIRNKGTHIESWNGRDNIGQEVASGVYFYRMKAGEFVETKRMVFLK